MNLNWCIITPPSLLISSSSQSFIFYSSQPTLPANFTSQLYQPTLPANFTSQVYQPTATVDRHKYMCKKETDTTTNIHEQKDRKKKLQYTVKEEIFVGEKFRIFPTKTFRMEFNFVLSNWPKKVKTGWDDRKGLETRWKKSWYGN